MKVIDLLVKIANGEEVPKFWWNGCIHRVEKDYTGNIYIFDTYCKKYKKIELEDFNEEIKFIEEDKKIEKLELVSNGGENSFTLLNEHGTKCCLTKHSKIMCDKINEIIDEVNKLKEGK